MPFLVRNLAPGPAVFTDLANNIALEWQGAGDPNGDDIQQVPDGLADNVNFLRSVTRGIFVVEEATEEMQAKLTASGEAWRRRNEAQAKAAIDTLEKGKDADFVTAPCVAPGPRGGDCGVDVIVRHKHKGEKPPLCDRHAHLGSQLVLIELDKMVDGVPVTKWIIPTIGEAAPSAVTTP